MPIAIYESRNGQFQVWSEPEHGDYKLGRCIGVGKTREDAIVQASQELSDDLQQLITNPPATMKEDR